MAPAFALARVEGGPFTERDLQGATSVLVFYPFAFSPTCTEQLRVYEDARPEFERRGATLYGVSCDAVWSQQAFKDKLGVSMEQLSDFEPKGAACRAFDVLHPGGFPERALVIADPSGEVVWRHVADSPGDLPPVQLILDALDSLEARRAA